MMTFMKEYRPVFMVVTFGFLGAAFYVTYRPPAGKASGARGRGASPAGAGGGTKMMSYNKIMLWGVTAVAIVFLFFPHVVTTLLASGDVFTADMERTVITIEGMT
jgi:hypothetical protein